MFSDSALQQFKKNIRGEVLQPGDALYDPARGIWNRMIDKRPALIARCLGTADVIRCVEFAREHSLAVAVRGGGHNIAGKCLCDGGFVIDLSRMKGIHVDPLRRTARAQAGLRLGEFDGETQVFGLATTMGVATDTGVAGITLGGGYGWLDGKFGLACDNLISAEVVTAEGKVLTASADENPDLFWGLRGGSGNFGIVTSFEFRLHPVGPILGGAFSIPWMWPKRRSGCLTSSREIVPMRFPPFSRALRPLTVLLAWASLSAIAGNRRQARNC